MTASSATDEAPFAGPPGPPAGQCIARAAGGLSWSGGLRLAILYAGSRRIVFALAGIAVCAAGLRVAAFWHWDSYGAIQLPLVFETGCAAMIAAAGASPFGDAEQAAGRWLPALRLGAALALTASALGAVASAGIGAHLAGGFLAMTRNVAGVPGLGLLCCAALGAGLAWIGPAGYLIVVVYTLYAQWHGGGGTTPWLWPARPPQDGGAWLCAGFVFVAGVAVAAVRGARDQVS